MLARTGTEQQSGRPLADELLEDRRNRGVQVNLPLGGITLQEGMYLAPRKDPKGLLVGPTGGELHVWIYHTQEVDGLTAKSFRVFEDGVEQRIQHFSVETTNTWLVRDNVGEHLEHSWTPTGIWSASDKTQIPHYRPSSSYHTYLITYVPPPSPDGSCHRITLKVDHSHATILAPDQYCNTNDPLSDPFNETAVGNKLLEYAKSSQASSIPIQLRLTAFSGPSGAPRLNVSAEIAPELLEHQWKANQLLLSVAVLGLVYDKNHALVRRFSDTVCPPPECGLWYEGAIPPNNVSIPQVRDNQKYLEDLTAPRSYRTQLELEPGDYQLEVAITDGQKFGRAEASVTVDDFRTSTFGISGIALCKRYHEPSFDERGPTRAPHYVPLMFDGQELTLAGDMHFKRVEKLITHVEIYSPQLGSTPPPEFFMEMKVMNTKTGELRIGTGPLPVYPSTKIGNTIPFVWTMEIEKLPPSTYRLEAQASDSAGNKTAWRVASFTIE